MTPRLQFKRDFTNLQHAWDAFESQEHPDDNQPDTPLFFDFLNGPRFLLTRLCVGSLENYAAS